MSKHPMAKTTGAEQFTYILGATTDKFEAKSLELSGTTMVLMGSGVISPNTNQAGYVRINASTTTPSIASQRQFGTAAGAEYGGAACLTSTGDVFMSGLSGATHLLSKHSSAFAITFQKTGTNGVGTTRMNSMIYSATDTAVFATGYCAPSTGVPAIFIASFNATTGAVNWIRTLRNTAWTVSSGYNPYEISLRSDGMLCVSGYVPVGSDYHPFIISVPIVN